MTEILKKYDHLLPLIAAVLFFLTQRDTFPVLVYTIFIVLIGVYFFSLKDVILGDNFQLKEKDVDFLGLFANFIISVLLVISVPFLYLNDNDSIKMIIKILALINFALLIYFNLKNHLLCRWSCSDGFT